MHKWKHWQVYFCTAILYLNVCVQLARIKVIWVSSHSAFAYCNLVFCDLLSQKGFSLHECIQCSETQIKSKKLSAFLAAKTNQITTFLLFDEAYERAHFSWVLSVLHWMVPHVCSPVILKATHNKNTIMSEPIAACLELEWPCVHCNPPVTMCLMVVTWP